MTLPFDVYNKDGSFTDEFLLWLGEELVGIAEIIDIMEEHPNFQRRVSKQRVFELSHNAKFPAPVASLSMGRLWLRTEVNDFLAERRIPGRPPREREQ